MVEIFALAISLFLGVHFCFLPTGDRRSNLLLGLLLMQMATGYIDLSWGTFPIPSVFIHLIEFLSSPFIFSTLLLFYFFSISRTPRKDQKKYKWIFVPILANLILRTCTYFVETEDGSGSELLHAIDSAFALIELLFTIGVSLLILFLIKKHNKTILNYFSSLEKKQLNWLSIIIIINLGFFVLWMIDDGLRHFIGENIVSHIISEVSLFATLINVLWIGLSSLRQPPIYPEQEQVEVAPVSEESDTVVLNNTEDMSRFLQIDKKIKDKAYYLNSSLTLGELADSLDVRDKELSRIINTCSNDSFYGYINLLRVEHFKSLLSNPDYSNLSILGMAMESGFKNRSTFYAAFRKVEGMTPKEYQSTLSS